MKHIFLSLLVVVGLIESVQAQSPYRLLLDDHEGKLFDQLSGVLPANRITLTTGDFNLGLLNEGPVYNDLFKQDQGGNTKINGQEIYNNLKDNNLLTVETELKTFGIAFRLGKVGLGFQHSIAAYNYFNYPKELFGTLFVGNAQYIGETVPIGPGFKSVLMNSFGFGAGVEFSKIKAAAKLNLLTGLAGAQTPDTKLDLFTDPEYYQIKLTSNYKVENSGLVNLDSISSGKILSDIENYDLGDIFKSNFGLSLDFALRAELTEKLSAGVSIKRLGYINFTENTNIYTSNKEISYNGLDLSKYVTKDSVAFEGLLDSLKDLVKFDKKSASFKMKLSPELHVFAKYHLTPKLGLFGAAYYSALPDRNYFSASAGVSFTPISLITAGGNLTYTSDSSINLGLHAMLNFWKLSIQLGTDNILAAINPKNSNFTTVYSGIRWNF